MTTETKETKTLFGIPIQGDFHANPGVQQKPIEDLFPLVKAVLDDKSIIEFGWQQYIPGFNDGEPCLFSTSGTYAKIDVGEEQELEDEDYGHEGWDRDGGSNYDKFVGEVDSHWEYLQDDGTWSQAWSRLGSKRVADGYKGPDQERHDRIEALLVAIESGEFDHALEGKFGYNVEISFRNHTDPEGIKIVVDEYSCGY